MRADQGDKPVKRLVAAALFTALAFQARAACDTKTITCGSSSTESITPSSSCVIDGFPASRYVFNGTAGQKLTLIARNNSTGLIGMELLSSTGEQLSSAFDEPAQITVTLPTSGQYFIQINLANPHVSGTVTLGVTCSSGTVPPPTQCSYSGVILIGQSITGQLTSADTPCGDSTAYAKAYRVPVLEGDAFTVDYSAPSYPPEIQVVGPDTSSAYRRTTGSALSTAYVAPTSGNITIYVYSNTTSPKTGTFTLTLTPLTLPSCGKIRAVKH